MSVPTVNVTLTVCDQTGAAVQNAPVTARLTALDLYNAQYVFPNAQSFLTDVNGLVTMPLFPNAIGQRNTFYNIHATHPVTNQMLVNVTVQIPNASVDVSALVGNNPSSQPYPLPSVQPYSTILTSLASKVLNGASLINMLQSGVGAKSESLQSAFNRLIHSAQYDTPANFTAAVAALTGALGLAGIQFPAIQVPSANVNTLDDYKEGTWIPVLAGNAGHSPASYFTQKGRYTKIGNYVNFSAEIQINGYGSLVNSESVFITGLSFTPGSGATYPGRTSVSLIPNPGSTSFLTTPTFPHGRLDAGDPTVYLRSSLSADLLKDDLRSNSNFFINGGFWV